MSQVYQEYGRFQVELSDLDLEQTGSKGVVDVVDLWRTWRNGLCFLVPRTEDFFVIIPLLSLLLRRFSDDDCCTINF